MKVFLTTTTIINKKSPICIELNNKINVFKKTKTYEDNLALIKKTKKENQKK